MTKSRGIGKGWRAGRWTPNRIDVGPDSVAIWLSGSERPALIDVEDVDRALARRWLLRGSPKNYVTSLGPRIPGKPRQTLYLHRFILSAPAGFEVDHLNGDTLDNRKCNLRLTTRAQNAQNILRGPDRGVRFDRRYPRRGWYASLQTGGHNYFRGYFETKEEAAAAAAALRSEYFTHANEERHPHSGGATE